jgi:pimeloyl-ACP methyl ester carboxylesterase
LPTETQDPEEKFAGTSAAERNANLRDAEIGFAIEEHWLQFPDGRMRYLKAGSGPALILIHGLMGYSFSWRFTIPALAAHATVYAIDNLGAGLSTATDGLDCTTRATAERVLQFADAVGIADFDLLGTSHGGGVAIMVAAICAERSAKRSAETSAERSGERDAERKSSRLQRLVLVAPVNPWSRHGKRLAPFVGSAFGSLLFRHTFARWRPLHDLGLRRMFGDTSKIPPDSLDGYFMPVLKNRVFHHGLRVVKSWTADLAELESVLPTIRDYPTLLIWGTNDRAVYFQSAEPLRRNFRDARLVALEGVGHLPYEEASEDFNRALVDFLIGAPSSQFPVQSSVKPALLRTEN